MYHTKQYHVLYVQKQYRIRFKQNNTTPNYKHTTKTIIDANNSVKKSNKKAYKTSLTYQHDPKNHAVLLLFS